MKPVQFMEQNGVANPIDENTIVKPLPIFRQGDTFISCWQMSDDEYAEVMKTKKIWVGITTGNDPEISVFGLKPFIYQDDE